MTPDDLREEVCIQKCLTRSFVVQSFQVGRTCSENEGRSPNKENGGRGWGPHLKRLDYVTLSEKGPGKPEVVTEGKDCRRLD